MNTAVNPYQSIEDRTKDIAMICVERKHMFDEMNIKSEMLRIENCWKDKPKAPYMSREYIDRRFDRTRYIKLKTQLNVLKAKRA